MPVPIVHNPVAQRFEATVDGHIAVLEYEERGVVRAFTHTLVPEALRGCGLAAALTAAALAHARASGWRIRPECSYVAAYLRKHPEQAGLVAGPDA